MLFHQNLIICLYPLLFYFCLASLVIAHLHVIIYLLLPYNLSVATSLAHRTLPQYNASLACISFLLSYNSSLNSIMHAQLSMVLTCSYLICLNPSIVICTCTYTTTATLLCTLLISSNFTTNALPITIKKTTKNIS